MKIEKIDGVAFGARAVDKASSFPSQLLNTKFDRMEPVIWGRKMNRAFR